MIRTLARHPRGRITWVFICSQDHGEEEGIEICFERSTHKALLASDNHYFEDADKKWLQPSTPNGYWIINMDELKSRFGITDKDWIHGRSRQSLSYKDGNYCFIIKPRSN